MDTVYANGQDFTLTDAGLPIRTVFGIRCGNHGKVKVWHENIEAIRYCFEIRYEGEAAQADAYRAEMAVERALEDRGYWEARAQEEYEARTGALDFIDAWHAASPTTCPCCH